MNLLKLFLLIALCSIPCGSQSSELSKQGKECFDKAEAQNSMNACASEEAARVDAELNRVYGILLSKAAGDQNALKAIKAAERAWVAYRDAYMEAMYPDPDKQASYGSIFPMEYDLLRAKLTRQQIEALRELINQ